jgi:hypothetical protein
MVIRKSKTQFEYFLPWSKVGGLYHGRYAATLVIDENNHFVKDCNCYLPSSFDQDPLPKFPGTP